MISNVIRGLIISIMSAIIITFMVFFFTPLLPFNVFEGNTGILIFFSIALISFLVYVILPPESSNSRSTSTNLQPDVHNDIET